MATNLGAHVGVYYYAGSATRYALPQGSSSKYITGLYPPLSVGFFSVLGSC